MLILRYLELRIPEVAARGSQTVAIKQEHRKGVPSLQLLQKKAGGHTCNHWHLSDTPNQMATQVRSALEVRILKVEQTYCTLKTRMPEADFRQYRGWDADTE